MRGPMEASATGIILCACPNPLYLSPISYRAPQSKMQQLFFSGYLLIPSGSPPAALALSIVSVNDGFGAEVLKPVVLLFVVR